MLTTPNFTYTFADPDTDETTSQMEFCINPDASVSIDEENTYVLIDLGTSTHDEAPELVHVTVAGGVDGGMEMPPEIKEQILTIARRSLANAVDLVGVASGHNLMEIPEVPTKVDVYPQTTPDLEDKGNFLLLKITVEDNGCGFMNLTLRGHEGRWEEDYLAAGTLPFLHFGIHAIRNELKTLQALMEAE